MMSIDARDTQTRIMNTLRLERRMDVENSTFRVDRISSGKGLPQID